MGDCDEIGAELSRDLKGVELGLDGIGGDRLRCSQQSHLAGADPIGGRVVSCEEGAPPAV